MADVTEGVKRLMRYNLLLTHGGTYILQKYCEKMIEGTTKSLEQHIKEYCQQGGKKLTTNMLNKIKKHNFDIFELNDVSLLTSVILAMFSKKVPSDDRQRLRQIQDKRNCAAHPESLELDEGDFISDWHDLSGWFIQLSKSISVEVYNEVQLMVKNYKIIQISESKFHGDLSSLQELLWNYLSKTSEAEESNQKLTEFIETLEMMKEKDYGYGVELKLYLQSFDNKTRALIEEYFTLSLNDVVQKAGGKEYAKILPVIQKMKQDLSCQGSNQVLNAARECISITIICPTRVGLLKLLRYVTSDTFRDTMQQISTGLSENTSQEVRITSFISQKSLKQLSAYIDGSKEVEVSEESTVCYEHHGETIEYFCKDHEQFCCKVCTGSNHRSCTLQYLGEMKPVDVAPVIKNLDHISSNIQEKKSLFEQELAKLKAAREQQELEISARKIELSETLNNLETQQEECIKHYDKLVQEKGEVIGKEISSCETTLKEIKTLQTSLESSKSRPKAIQFIAYKKCELKIRESKSIVEAKQQKLNEVAIPPDELKFKLDTKQIEESLQHLQKDILKFKDIQSKSKEPTGLESEYLPTVTTTLKAKHVTPKVAQVQIVKAQFIKKEHIKQVNVSLKGDKGPSSVRGCCATTTGDILVADNNNCKLKRIRDREVTDFVDLAGHPWDVCVTDTHTAVVAVFRDTLQFVNTLGKMIINKSLKLSHNCRSLAFDKTSNRLVILDQSHVYLYTQSGMRERVLYSQPPPAISLRVITVSPSFKRYCISTFNDGLILIDDSGSRRMERKLKHITGGVCYTPDSNIFVTRKDSVSQFNEQFEINHIIKHGITSPLSLCFNEKESELIIGQDNDSVIMMPV